ncbi:hypothetical protein GCM10007862_33350 [Dyella lipolytica]|nr:hypothetical protein GCM10007862_33350 [Dyella lipolytica]
MPAAYRDPMRAIGLYFGIHRAHGRVIQGAGADASGKGGMTRRVFRAIAHRADVELTVLPNADQTAETFIAH